MKEIVTKRTQSNDYLFSQLLLWQKFLILGVLAVLFAVIPFGSYLATTQNDIDVAKHELQGIKPSRLLQKLNHLMRQHANLSILVLADVQTNKSAQEIKAKEIAELMAEIDAVFKEQITDQLIINDWTQVNQHWQILQSRINNADINVQLSIKFQSDLIAEQMLILEKISDYFELSLDPKPDSYFLVRGSLYAVPQYLEMLEHSKNLGEELLEYKQFNSVLVSSLSTNISLAQIYKREAEAQLGKVFTINPVVKIKLEAVSQSAFNLGDIAMKLAEHEILKENNMNFDAIQYVNAFTTALDAIYNLNLQTIDQLEQIITQRKNHLITGQRLVAIGFILLFGAGLVVSYLIALSVLRPLKHLVGIMQALSKGESAVRVNTYALDEIGMLGRQFDKMVDQREATSAAILKENEILNNSIIEILYAVAKLAQRDFTVKAPVAEDVTGPLGDALNLLSGEISNVLTRVVEIAGEVAKSSLHVKAQADSVINLARIGNLEVERSALELSAASEVMLDIAQLALSCNKAASLAIENTEKAQETVFTTIQGITSIRDTIRETEKRIKRLGERSQEISSITTIINNIAERTHILALNAAMHAASAGEAGKGFAVVANEVQKLAENAREATLQISSLVNNIQVETADTIITMNDAISRVVQGTAMAQQAGNEMRETRDATANLVEMVQRISENSRVQADTTQRLSERSILIQKSSEETYRQLQDQGEQTQMLVDFSENLVDSVSVFILPEAKPNLA